MDALFATQTYNPENSSHLTSSGEKSYKIIWPLVDKWQKNNNIKLRQFSKFSHKNSFAVPGLKWQSNYRYIRSGSHEV